LKFVISGSSGLGIHNNYLISLNMEINIRSDSKKQLTLLMRYIRKNTITADVDHVTDRASQELPVAHNSVQLKGVSMYSVDLKKRLNIANLPIKIRFV
jgi:hypothetical protein